MKNQLAELKALLTPECAANRLARAQGNAATNDAANPPSKKINAAAIAVPVVLVLLVAAVAATVVVMKARGNNAAHAEVELQTFAVPAPEHAAPTKSMRGTTSEV